MSDAENIEWAAKAYADGRSLDFIASVLEVKPQKALRLIRDFRGGVSVQRQVAERTFNAIVVAPVERRAQPNFILIDEEGQFSDRPQTDAQALAMAIEARDLRRRRFLLLCRFARHWDMIWFLRRCRMSGRAIRKIYGAETLIWSVGGGINTEITA